MIFIIHAELKNKTIHASLGRPDYSYYFVLKQFKPMLQKHGLVFEVDNSNHSVDRICKVAKALGQQCVFLSFAPPHKTPMGLACPIIPVFAWEYSTIPNESWGGDERNNWAEELRKHPAAITHSRHTREVVKQAVDPAYPIASIPAPVWDQFEKYYNPNRSAYFNEPIEIQVHGWVIDSTALHASAALRDDIQGCHRLKLSGAIYTSVFSPNDGRKNWPPLVQAFCWAFKEVTDATLILKLSHPNPAFSLKSVLIELFRLMPFKCRVLLIHGYLSEDEYKCLIQATSYVVNSAFGEGQCLPLMEFMSAGCPAVAPDHSGMADYVCTANSFVVNSSLEWTVWPHDPRVLLRTFRRRVDWGALHDCYLASYMEAKHHPEIYRLRSARARKDLQNHCSRRMASRRLKNLIATSLSRCGKDAPSNPGMPARIFYAAAGFIIVLIGLVSGFISSHTQEGIGASMRSRIFRLCQKMSGLPVISRLLWRIGRKLKFHALRVVKSFNLDG